MRFSREPPCHTIPIGARARCTIAWISHRLSAFDVPLVVLVERTTKRFAVRCETNRISFGPTRETWTLLLDACRTERAWLVCLCLAAGVVVEDELPHGPHAFADHTPLAQRPCNAG